MNKTVEDILGRVMIVLTGQIALGQDDQCSRCRRRLAECYAIYLANCGRYCSRGCAEADAEHIRGAAFVSAFERGAIRAEQLFQAGLLPRPEADEP